LFVVLTSVFWHVENVVHTCKECGAKYSGSREETSKRAQKAGLCKSCYGVSACAISTSTHIVTCATDAQRAQEKADNERATQSRTSPQQKKTKRRRLNELIFERRGTAKRSPPASSGPATKKAKKTATTTRRKKTPPPAPLDDVAGPCTFAPFSPSPSGRGVNAKRIEDNRNRTGSDNECHTRPGRRPLRLPSGFFFFKQHLVCAVFLFFFVFF